MSSFCKMCGAWMSGDVCPSCNTQAPKGDHLPPAEATTHCSECGKRVKASESYCPYCGKEVNVKERSLEQKSPVWVNPKTLKDGKMHCPHCDELVDVKVVFCPSCGKDMRKKYSGKSNCIYCGGVLNPTSEFCPSCGKSVEEKVQLYSFKGLNCNRCGNRLEEGVLFCTRCGLPTPKGREMGKVARDAKNICPRCGGEYNPNAPFCSSCGQSTMGYSMPQSPVYNVPTGGGYYPNMYQQPAQVPYTGYGAPYNPYAKTPTQTLASREKLSAVIWLIVAALQALAGVFFAMNMEDFGEYTWISYVGVAVWNGVNVYHSFQRAQRVLARVPGIVEEYNNTLATSILFIIINVLFGGIIGVGGAIFDLVNRNYALKHAPYLEDMRQ